MFMLIFSIFVVRFFFNFRKKVRMLLTLEGLILVVIFFFGTSNSFAIIRCFLCLLLSIFIVLDSVLGITLLISRARLNRVMYQGFSSL